MIALAIAGWAMALIGWSALLSLESLRPLRLRSRRRVLPVNVLPGGIVLPEPDDPRWESDFRNGRMILGVIRVNTDTNYPGVSVDGIRIGDFPDYGSAVLRAYVARRALISIQGDE